MSVVFLRPIVLFHSLTHLLVVFLARHWLLGLANAGLTALLGLGLLRLAALLAPSRTLSSWYLRLRQIVLVAALFKGAFYLVLGDGHRMRVPDAFGYGLQCPGLLNVIPLVRHSIFTIWRPTEVTGQVGLVLAGFAFVMLARRCWQFASLLRWLRHLYLAAASDIAMLAPLEARAHAALRRAADAMALPPKARLPTLVLTELPEATPVLLGLWRSYVLLPPSLVEAFTDHQLEMALRHELAHLRRGDHWRRWLLLWLEDLGRLIPLMRWCSGEVMALDEQLCDRQCVKSVRDAAALAQALNFCRRRPPVVRQAAGPPVLPRYVLPQMVGGWNRPGTSTQVLQVRLQHLLAFARAAGSPQVLQESAFGRSNAGVASAWRTALTIAGEGLLVLLLLLVVYAKCYCIVNVS